MPTTHFTEITPIGLQCDVFAHWSVDESAHRARARSAYDLFVTITPHVWQHVKGGTTSKSIVVQSASDEHVVSIGGSAADGAEPGVATVAEGIGCCFCGSFWMPSDPGRLQPDVVAGIANESARAADRFRRIADAHDRRAGARVQRPAAREARHASLGIKTTVD